MVTGDAVNVAARLEQSADPGGIVVAERTARAARGFRFRELGDQELRGKEQPIPAVVLEERTPGADERGVPGLHAPMVGRDRELELLRSLYQRSAEEGQPNLVTIYGDPGVGKSRLVAEFVASASIEALVGRGRACVNARRGLAELAGLLGEVLRRARARAREAAMRRLLGRCDTGSTSSPGQVP